MREQLLSLLEHYFKTIWEAAGLTFDSDNYLEIEEMVDLIIALRNE